MDKREAFRNFLRASFGANDNGGNSASSDAPHTQMQSQISNNWSGNTNNTINIGKIELSITLPDLKKAKALYRTIQKAAENPASKKNLTDRAIVLPDLLSILATDSLSKKSPSYPPAQQPERAKQLKKNLKQPSFNDQFFHASQFIKNWVLPVGTDIKKTALERVIQCNRCNDLFYDEPTNRLYAL